MTADRTSVPERRTAQPWIRHVVGVGLGLVFLAAFAWQASLTLWLERTRSTEFVAWPAFARTGLLLLVGVALVTIVVAAARLPALPTTVAAVLLYGTAAGMPVSPLHRLPVLGPWQPRLGMVAGGDTGPTFYWETATMAVVAGATLAAAGWGWWSYARARRDAATETWRRPPVWSG